MKKDKKQTDGKDNKDKKDPKKDKNAKEDDAAEKQRLAKMESTIQSLQADQMPAIRLKLQTASEASRVLKAALKANRLNTIDIFGPGICDSAVKDLCQALRSLTSITYLGLRNYSIDSNTAYNDLLKTIAQHKQLSTLHIDLLNSAKLKMPELLPSIRDCLSNNTSITKFSLMGHNIKDAGVSLFSPWVASSSRLKFLDLSHNGVTEDGFATLCEALVRNTSVRALHMQKMELSGRYPTLLQPVLHSNTNLTRIDLSHCNAMQSVPPVTQLFNSLASIKHLVSLGLNDVKLGNEGAAILFKLLSEGCSLRNVRLNDNQISKMDALNWDMALNIDEFHIAGNPIGDAGLRRLTRSLRFNNGLRTLNVARCGISDEALKEFSVELAANITLTSVSLKKEDEGLGLDSTGVRYLQRNVNMLKLHEALAPPVSELPPPELTFPFGNKSVFLNRLSLDEEASVARLVKKLPSDTTSTATSLSLARNSLYEFPSVPVLLFTALTHLDISGNRLQTIPPDIGSLKALTALDARCNRLESLPMLLGQLTRLKHLYVQRNKLSSLPVSVLENCPIETLALEGNPISAGRDLVYREWSSTSLNLANLGLKYMPREIVTLPKLRELLLADNALISIPQEISLLTTLTSLDLSRNRIDHLPWQLGKLGSLQTVKLQGNPLTTLSESLRISCSTREAVPFSELREYLLSLARSRSAPSRLRLVILGSSKSGKTSLLKAIGGGDGIQRTPSGVFREAPMRDSLLKTRQSLDEPAPPGPLKSSSSPNVSKPRGLFEQMEDLSQKAAKPGDAPVPRKGSESLEQYEGSTADLQITRIAIPMPKQGQPPTDESPPRKSGSGVSRPRSSMSRGELAQFDVWDFTGDETTNVAHTFFITKRTTYLLVFNASQPLEQQYHALDYWMAAITSRAKGCPVLLVGTHTDSKRVTSDSIDLLRDQLDKRYCQRFDVSVLALVSTRTNKGVPEFVEILLKETTRQPFAIDPIPDVYTSLDYQLRQLVFELPTPMISTTKFAEVAQQCGVGPHLMAMTLETMHDLGALLYVRGSRAARNAKAIVVGPQTNPGGPSLSEGSSRRSVGDSERESFPSARGGQSEDLHAGLVTLDPVWLSNVFRSLHHRLAGKDGTMTVEEAASIWSPPQHPPGSAPMYLELLEKFEMTFPLKRGNSKQNNTDTEEVRLLVPMLLPAEPPSGLSVSGYLKKEGGASLVFTRVYQMPFLPQGLFAHILVRVLTIADPVHYWRSGVVLSLGSPRTVAAITTDQLTTVTLAVTGTNCGSLLLVLSNAVESLLQLFMVSSQSFVQCSCTACTKSDKPHLYVVAELIGAFVSGAGSAKCKSSQLDVPLANLAPDLTLLTSFLMPYASLKKGKKLGRGGFAIVYEATLPDGSSVALKELTDVGSQKPEGAIQLFNEFRQEAFTWSEFKHENVLRLRGVCLRPLCFVMELSPFGTLHEYLRANPKMVWSDRLQFAKDVVKGLQYLHNLTPPVIHRDVKSHNVLIGIGGDKRPQAKLADFGVCVTGTMAIGRVVDNPVWLAPEVMMGKDYGPSADVYSLGIVLWEIVTGREPFAEFNFQLSSMLEDQILLGLRPTIPDSCPEFFSAVVRRCWHRSPSHRPSANEIMPMFDVLNIMFRL